jgi:hypothetical protein
MYTNGFAFECFFFLLFTAVSLVFAGTTAKSRDAFGRVLGFFVTLGFLKLTVDAGIRTGYALFN